MLKASLMTKCAGCGEAVTRDSTIYVEGIGDLCYTCNLGRQYGPAATVKPTESTQGAMNENTLSEATAQLSDKFSDAGELREIVETLYKAALDAPHAAERERGSEFYNDVEAALDTVLVAICPPPCKMSMIDPAWWDTPAGEIISAAQYWLYADQLISPAEAARRVYGDSLAKSIVGVERYVAAGKIRRVRRTDATFSWRRKEWAGSSQKKKQGWLIFANDVENVIAERAEKTAKKRSDSRKVKRKR